MSEMKLNPGASRDNRRSHLVAVDVKRLRLQIKCKQFDWSQRYSAKYLCDYARDFGWNQSRLNNAVELLDDENRRSLKASV